MNEIDGFFTGKLGNTRTADEWRAWMSDWGVIKAKITDSPKRYIRLPMGDERIVHGNGQDRDCWVDAVNLSIYWTMAGEDPNVPHN